MNFISPDFLRRSREAFAPDTQMTLAAVKAATSSDPALDPVRRRDLLSAFRRLELWSGRPLATVPANPKALRQVFTTVEPAVVGTSRKNFANVRALVFNANHRYGNAPAQLTKRIPLTPEWNGLLERISQQHLRHGLLRLAAFCSAMEISPTAVDQAALSGLHAALEEEEAVKQPRSIIKNTISAWNRCRRTVPGWPAVSLVSPFKKMPVTLPLSAFSRPFQSDVARWKRLVTDEYADDEDAPAMPLRETTIECRLFQLRQYASCLVTLGIVSIEELSCLADLFTLERFKAAMRWLRQRPRDKESRRIYYLAGALLNIAKHYCRIDAGLIEQLQALRRKLDPHVPRQMSKRTREQIRQFDDNRNVTRLLRFPQQQIALAQREENPFRAAKRIERALVVQLMTYGGLRQVTLRKLHTSGDFSWTRPNYGGVCHLHVPGTKIKNRRDAERQLPPVVADTLKVFLLKHRQHLPGANGPFLFPGEDGGMRSRNQFRDQISRALLNDAGLKLTPHRIRAAVAKIVVERDPSAYLAVSRVLGHTSLDTTTAHYLGTETNAVAKQFDAVLAQAADIPPNTLPRPNRRHPCKPRPTPNERGPRHVA